MKKVKNHFKKYDPVLYSYFKKTEAFEVEPVENLFEELCASIISQQLSGKAADTIFAKFKALFPKKNITAKKLLKIPGAKVRKAGTSWAKVKSLKDLAQKTRKKEVHLEKLFEMPDEEVIQELTKVKGIGPWTAEMFLMFALGRKDVFSYGDLGLKKAMQKLYGFKQMPTQKQIEKIVSKWSPYRTYASRVLWKSLEL